jgi:hypothetical protein
MDSIIEYNKIEHNIIAEIMNYLKTSNTTSEETHSWSEVSTTTLDFNKKAISIAPTYTTILKHLISYKKH